MLLLTLLPFLSLLSLVWSAPTDTTTWGGDNTRTGYQNNHNMDPAVVGSAQFGQIFKTNLPGRYGGVAEQVFASPLVYTTGDNVQYVYLATQQNNIYKLNAKTGVIVASRNLHIPFLTSDLDGCVDINPHVGSTATGVIDPSTNTWYLTTKTYVDQSANGAKGRPNGRYYFHAISVDDLSERPGFPVDLEGTVARNNPSRSFNGGIHHQRPALLLEGQYVYAGFASHCVKWNFTGWIMGWDKSSGNIVERYATEGAGVKNTVPGAGVWMSGGGIASDGRGSMFFATGNGYASQLNGIPVNGRNPPTALEEAAVHMTINGDGTLTPVDFFMPWEKTQLDGADKDLGTSPLEILPSQFSCGNVKRIGVVTGKSGKTYWIDLDNMGGYQNGPNKLDAVLQVYQNENSVYAGAGVYPGEGGYIYINVIQYQTHVFKFSCDAGVPSFTKVADTPEKNAYILGVGHGTVTSLRDQPGTGLVWVSDVEGANLRVYNAVPQNGVLNLIKAFNIPGTTKFGRPVFGDGMVYHTTLQGAFYGFGSPVNNPVNCSSPYDFGTVNVNASSPYLTIQCTANIPTQINSIGINGNKNFILGNLTTLPLTLAAGAQFSFQAAFTPLQVGSLSSDALINTTNAGNNQYSTSIPVRLKGIGQSQSALLGVTPNTVSFDGVITGEQAGGVSQSAILLNQGVGNLTISQMQCSTVSETGPFTSLTIVNGTVSCGGFTISKIPQVIPGNSQAAVNIDFNPPTSGNYAAFIQITSNGGVKLLDILGVAGTYPTALVEFQTPDGTGWVPYSNSTPFTFGDVYQNTARNLKMRLTNVASNSSTRLSVTVSKPPFGVPGIIGAVNQVDLAEGTTLAPGESATATLFCAAPKSQYNIDTYTGNATWTLNLGDPNFGKQVIQFACNAVTQQTPPLYANGSSHFRYKGCYKDNNPGRQMKTQLYGLDTNTNQMCVKACADAGWAYAATEYTRECWCSNTIPNLQVDEGNCNFACTGDVNQICGGNGLKDTPGSYISLFHDDSLGAALPPTTGPTPTPGAPVTNPGVNGWTGLGCYTEGTGGRALPNGQNTKNNNTVANCIKLCKGYTYAGVEYGNECYCGNSLGTGSVPAPLADCSMTCSGNASEFCGAGNRLNVYSLAPVVSSSVSSSASSAPVSSVAPSVSASSVSSAAPSPTPTGPTQPKVVGNYTFVDCHTEATQGRALTGKAFASDTMTLDICATTCAGFTYMAVEYGRECYCGNSLNAGSVTATDGRCNMLCASNKFQYCGGPNGLSLYQLTPVVVPSVSPSPSASSSIASSSAASSVSSAASSSASASDSSVAPSSSASSSAASSSASDSSVAPSSSASSSAASSISSVASSSASSVAPSSSASPSASSSVVSSVSSSAVSSAAPSPVPTGPTQPKVVGNYTFVDCHTELTQGRALADKAFASDTMTLDICATTCAGFTYMAVEFGRECYCGNTLGAGSVTATDGRCNMLCANNQFQYCGGPNGLSLYQVTPVVVPSVSPSPSASSSVASSSSSAASSVSSAASSSASDSSVAPSSSASPSASSSVVSSSTSSAAPSPSPTGPTQPKVVGNYTFVDCHTEATQGRALTGKAFASDTMTLDICATTCNGFTYMAVEYGRECYCGNTLNAGSITTLDGRCKMLCASNKLQICGGSNGLSLYQLTPAVVPSVSPSPSAISSVAPSSSAAPISSSSSSVPVSSAAPSSSASPSASSSAASSSASDSSSISSASSSASSVSSSASSSVSSAASSVSSSASASASSSAQSSSASASPSASSSVSSSASSSASLSSSAVPSPSASATPWVYVGCANETNPRALSGAGTTSNTMTIQSCQAFCLSKNMPLAGLEYGQECYCGVALQSYSAIGFDGCNMPCAGDATQTCGAGGRISLYNYTAYTPPMLVPTVGTYQLQGCYTEPGNGGGRALPSYSFTNSTSMSAELCVAGCQAKGYTMAGMEYGQECWCANALNTKSTKVADSQCNMLCPGNKREYCGAGSRLAVYKAS